ncbi:hypothetical protein F4801DRAFT_494794 [Xylaria longipes]|nr:hypothetical protein F4801DRAFT_494794 [Xylaria longipes]
MAAPIDKPVKTSHPGQPNKPIYARTSVLCNGQIAWKVGWNQDMEYDQTKVEKAELRPIGDVTDDLNALNSLQMYRAKPLTPLEVKQPLRHVQSSLPDTVRARIYTGDLYGSTDGVFSCPDDEFETKAKRVFENEARGDGSLNYNDFFRRLRRAEWLLWDVEAERGHWVAVIAHLYKSTIRNPNKKFFPDNDAIPVSIVSTDFNRIDEWCVVTTQRSPQGDAMTDRVRERLPTIFKEGRIGFDKKSEKPAIWVPMDETNWSSGLRVYSLIKTLMHRITEFHCTRQRHQPTFWDPVSGWLNVDEVRAEMQGRAAQRCMAATGYRSRIAIEGVFRWIGMKERVRANELRPRRRDNQAYCTGKIGEDGRCIPVGPLNPDSDGSDDGPDDGDGKGTQEQSKGEKESSPSGKQGDDDDDEFFDPIPLKHTPSDKKGKQPNPQEKPNVDQFGGPFKDVQEKPGVQGKTSEKKTTSHTQNKSHKTKFGGPLDPPPSKVHGWGSDTTDDSSPFKHVPIDKIMNLAKWRFERIQNDTANSKSPDFEGPLDPPPIKVHGWDGDSTDDGGPFKHNPVEKLELIKTSPRKQDPKGKGKGKQVDKKGKKNSKRTALEAELESAIRAMDEKQSKRKVSEAQVAADASKNKHKADKSKLGFNAILSMLGDSP